jgi:hypothetical protein
MSDLWGRKTHYVNNAYLYVDLWDKYQLSDDHFDRRTYKMEKGLSNRPMVAWFDLT